MQAFVNEAQQRVNLASQDKFPQQGHCPLGRVGHDAMPAAKRSNWTRCGGNVAARIDLAFDRVHRIVFTPITRVGHRIRSSSGNMSKLSLWPPGLANQCSATSGRLIAHAFRALDIEEQPHPVPVTYMNEAPSICDPSVGLDGLS